MERFDDNASILQVDTLTDREEENRIDWELKKDKSPCLAYPRDTSKNIINAKPSMAPIVAMSVFLSNCASGISSSTTT